jgi:hypothetical protein
LESFSRRLGERLFIELIHTRREEASDAKESLDHFHLIFPSLDEEQDWTREGCKTTFSGCAVLWAEL